MRVSLTTRESEMLVDAANRMLCDDIWDLVEEGGMYVESDSDTLREAANKIGGLLGDAERRKEARNAGKSK